MDFIPTVPVEVPNTDEDMDEENLVKHIAKAMSAAEEPVVLEKESSCYNPMADLSGYHLSTRKGTRSMLVKQNQATMENFLHELLIDIDKNIQPNIEDDDIGGKWIQSIYCSSVYSIDCFIFHITPNRSIDYIEDFKEIPGYTSRCITNHNIVASILDSTCANKDGCWYKNTFYPHVGKPGPIFLPKVIQDILEIKRHGMSLSIATNMIDLLCSFFLPIINDLDLKRPDGTKITSDSIQFNSNNVLELDHDFQHVKWAHNVCICCLFMKQCKIAFQAVSGKWVKNGSGSSKEDPLEALTLLGYESFMDKKSTTPDINILSNCININGYQLTKLNIIQEFQNYKIEPIECLAVKPRYQVVHLKNKD